MSGRPVRTGHMLNSLTCASRMSPYCSLCVSAFYLYVPHVHGTNFMCTILLRVCSGLFNTWAPTCMWHIPSCASLPLSHMCMPTHACKVVGFHILPWQVVSLAMRPLRLLRLGQLWAFLPIPWFPTSVGLFLGLRPSLNDLGLFCLDRDMGESLQENYGHLRSHHLSLLQKDLPSNLSLHQ